MLFQNVTQVFPIIALSTPKWEELAVPIAWKYFAAEANNFVGPFRVDKPVLFHLFTSV